MTIQVLQMSCNLEGVSKIEIVGVPFLSATIRCSSCSDKSSVFLDPNNIEEIDGSRGTANFVARCKGCNSKSSINFVPQGLASLNTKKTKKAAGSKPGVYGVIHEQDSGNMVDMFVLDSRGCEIETWSLHTTELHVFSSLSSNTFDNVVIEDETDGLQEVDPATYEQVLVQDIAYDVTRV